MTAKLLHTFIYTYIIYTTAPIYPIYYRRIIISTTWNPFMISIFQRSIPPKQGLNSNQDKGHERLMEVVAPQHGAFFLDDDPYTYTPEGLTVRPNKIRPLRISRKCCFQGTAYHRHILTDQPTRLLICNKSVGFHQSAAPKTPHQNCGEPRNPGVPSSVPCVTSAVHQNPEV